MLLIRSTRVITHQSSTTQLGTCKICSSTHAFSLNIGPNGQLPLTSRSQKSTFSFHGSYVNTLILLERVVSFVCGAVRFSIFPFVKFGFDQAGSFGGGSGSVFWDPLTLPH